jgi:hypothetical protein
VPDPVERKKISRDYLTVRGEDLKIAKRAFLSLDLAHGKLRAYVSEEYADVSPALVGACWHMHWPIPLLDNDSANRLIDAVAGSAEWHSVIRDERDPLGLVLYGGAGSAIDAIQRERSEVWRAYCEVQS